MISSYSLWNVKSVGKTMATKINPHLILLYFRSQLNQWWDYCLKIKLIETYPSHDVGFSIGVILSTRLW